VQFFQSSSLTPDLLAYSLLLTKLRKKLLFTLKFHLEQLLLPKFFWKTISLKHSALFFCKTHYNFFNEKEKPQSLEKEKLLPATATFFLLLT